MRIIDNPNFETKQISIGAGPKSGAAQQKSNSQGNDEPQRSMPDDSYSKFQKSKHIIDENCKNVCDEPPAIISWNNHPLIFLNTINCIQGKSGTHKSRLLEHITSILISKKHDISFVNFCKHTAETFTVIYIDTERNMKSQLPLVIKRIKRHAGFGEADPIQNFEYFSLIEVQRKDRMPVLSYHLSMWNTTNHSANKIIAIDVITDCICNFNDIQGSLQLIDLMNELINIHGVTFIVVIHENPSKLEYKARGHLGTELLNKSTVVLSLNHALKSKGVFELKFVKSRITSIWANEFLKYNPESEGLVTVDRKELKSSRQIKAPLDELVPFAIKELSKGQLSRKQFIFKITQKFGCNKKTAQNRIKVLCTSDLIAEHGFKLVGEKRPNGTNNEVIFRLTSNEHASTPAIALPS